jgi:isopentenyl phosphate kinase
MEGKIRELLGLSGRSYIFNASVPKRIEEIVLGKKTVATEIVGRN